MPIVLAERDLLRQDYAASAAGQATSNMAKHGWTIGGGKYGSGNMGAQGRGRGAMMQGDYVDPNSPEAYQGLNSDLEMYYAKMGGNFGSGARTARSQGGGQGAQEYSGPQECFFKIPGGCISATRARHEVGATTKLLGWAPADPSLGWSRGVT